MKKGKKENRTKRYRTMLDQEEGGMEDTKTNEDFNNEHPDHDENGLTKEESSRNRKFIKK